MSNQSNTPNEKKKTVQDIISEIEQKSQGGGYIYRGERKCYEGPPYYGKISSNLLYCHRKLGPPSKPRLCYNAILLKGVSDGETQTKNLHPRV